MPFLSRRLEFPRGPAIHVASVGDGAPFVFLHGVGRRGSTFQPLLPWLAEKWRVHLADHRGHGESDRAPSYLVSNYLADAVQVVETLADVPVVLYGHSLGALVAALVAAEKPDLVRAAILEDPPSSDFLANLQRTDYDSVFRIMARHAGPGMEAPYFSVRETARSLADSLVKRPDGSTVRFGDLRDPASIRFLASCLAHVDPAVYEPLLLGHWLEGLDWWSATWKIRCPVLLLHGDLAAGGMLPADDAERLKTNIDDLTAMPFKGAGHVLHWQHTGAVANHLLAFLESL